ncbi:MAG TPA: shikimate dehydrogenase [Acidimicrobiales bacterium]|nr:shikimate dehydrogenase [Acidimicrobiales bacterium]
MGTWPSAGTALAGVIGDPVEHSLSPVLHNAALVEVGLDWAYVAFPVPAGRGTTAVAAMVDLGIRGLSVTMPHKAAAAAACRRLSSVAERLGVVNTVTNVAGELVGDSTDGPGFVDALLDQGWDPQGKTCLVLGAGGAAKAVVLALAEAGAGQVLVAARRPEQAEETASFAGERGGVAPVDAAGKADLVVNATPVGMVGVPGTGGLPLGLDDAWLGSGQLVADLIYAPASTPLLAAARARGAGTVNGLGMLIHQAARQFRTWTGREAPVDVMSAAALRELRRRAEAGSLGEISQLGEPLGEPLGRA